MAEYGTMYQSDRLDLAKEIPLPAPLVIQLEPSGYCNLRCSFCPVNDPNEQEYFHRSFMTPELFGRFVRQCKAFPRPIKVLRLIGNGEPLMNPNIVSLVREAKLSEVFERVEITTNGTLLTSVLSDALVEAGLDVLRVSLEAIDDETFKRVSGVSVSTAELYEKLAYYYSVRGAGKLYIKTTDLAVETEEKRARFLAEYGKICDYIFVETVTDIWPEYTNVIGRKPRYDRTGRRICIQPFDLLNVLADGTVAPCCADWKQILVLGNLTETSLTELWNGEKLRTLRMELLQGCAGLPCTRCGFPAVSQSDSIDGAAEAILKRLY